MAEPAATPANPYAGPRALGPDDQIFGREREISALVDLLVAERVVLLYSPSGAGKTSLIEAKGGLKDRLQRQEGFRVLPPIRVGTSPAAFPDWPAGANRFLESAMRSLEGGVAVPAKFTGIAFTDYLKRWEGAESGKSTLLIFDQFEEILTIDHLSHAARLEFFQQIGLALREQNRWALFSMREDYFPALDTFARAIPTRLRNTFRLHLLSLEAARDAIEGPAKSAGVTFQPDAAEKLIGDLRQVWVQDLDGRREQQPSEEIEPVHLQLVCSRLWTKRASPSEITLLDVQSGPTNDPGTNAVDVSLGDYYAEQVAAAAGAVKEVVIRQWIEQHLILGAAVRNQVPQRSDDTEGLPNDIVTRLAAAHLLSRDPRHDAVWIELAHNRLIKPILANNAVWFRQHHSVLQRKADLWKEQGQSDALCLRDDALTDASDWAAQHADELRDVDREFLDRSVRLRDKAKSSRLYRLATALSIFALVTGALAGWAVVERNAARKQSDRATKEARRANEEATRANEQELVASSRGVAAQALSRLEQKIDLAILLAVEAQRRSSTPEARGALITAAFFNPRLQYILHAHTSVLSAIAFSPDGALLAAGDWAKSVLVWDLKSRQFVKQAVPFADVTRCVAFSPDGSQLAAGSKDGQLAVWARPAGDQRALNFGEPRMLPVPHAPANSSTQHDAGGSEVGRDVWAVAFSPDSRWLASSGENGQVLLWDAKTNALLESRPTLPGSRARALAFFRQGGDTFLAAANELPGGTAPDHFVWFWKITDKEGRPQLDERRDLWPDPPVDVHCLAVSADGRYLAAAGTKSDSDPVISMRDVRSGREWAIVEKGARVVSLAFDASSTKLIYSTDDGSISLRDAETGAAIGAPMLAHAGRVNAVAFHPTEQVALSGGMDSKLIAWDTSATRAAPAAEVNAGTKIAFSPDGQTKAVGNAEGSVVIMPASGNPAADAPHVQHPAASAHSMAIVAMGFSRDGRYLVSATRGGSVAILDTSSDSSAKMLKWQIQGLPTAVAVASDGRHVALGTEDGYIYLDDSGKAGAPTLLPPQHTDSKVWTLQFSKDDALLLSAADDDSAVVWDVAARQRRHARLEEHARPVRCATFSPDDSLIATGSVDNSVLIWNASTQRVWGQRLVKHTRPIISVAFSPDSQMLASSGEDEQVVVWDVQTTQQLGEPLPARNARGAELRFVGLRDKALLRLAGPATSLQEWDFTISALEERCRLRANRNLTHAEWQFFIGRPEYRPTWPAEP